MKELYLKNLLAVICCAVIPIGMSAQFSGSGSGTKDDPYRIFNADQLNQVRNFVGKTDVYFSLEADIDMTQWIAENNPSQGWLPIEGNNYVKTFNFNGNGHTIKNLWINRPNSNYVGLFGYIATEGRIYNLKLENANYVGKDYIGGIIAESSCMNLESCDFNGEISGNDYLGGILGYVDVSENTKINNCFSRCKIAGNDCAGGIVGKVSCTYDEAAIKSRSIKISNCSSYNKISGNSYIGGIIGSAYTTKSADIYVNSCYSYNAIKGKKNLGGITGFYNRYNSRILSYYDHISNCYTNGFIIGDSNIGGIAGYFEDRYGGIGITDCYANFNNIQGNNYVSGIIGNATSDDPYYNIKNNVAINKRISSINDLFRVGCNIENTLDYKNLAWTLTQMFLDGVKQPIPDDSDENGINAGLSSLMLQATYEGLGWDFTDTWQIEETESFPYFKNQTAPPYFQQTLKKGDTNLSGQCTEAGTVTVSIGDKVYTVQSSGNTWSLTLDEPLQAGDVVDVWVQVEGKMPSYVVSQTVSLLGGGTESDPFVISTPEDMQAISSDNTENAHYKLANDIDLTEWIETNSSTDGWIPVTLRGTFDGDGHTISGLWCYAEDGGLFDKLVSGAAVKDVKVKIADGKAVKGSNYAGGIVAISMGTITNSTVTGTIEGGSAAGGIAGQSSGSISQCYTLGEVMSETGSAKAGGIVGENQSGSSVNDSYSSAVITATEDNSYAAGIAGYNSGTIERCYSDGAISGYAIAGICGYNTGAEAKVNGCVAANRSLSAYKSALRVLGGYASDASAPVTSDNYAFEGMPVSVNNVPQKIYDDPLNGTTKTIDELYRKATYEMLGWDMENIWDIDEGSSLPYFEEFSIQVSEISLDKTGATLERQSTLQLTATVLPVDCRNTTLSWTSDNEEVATVDGNGLVTAVGVGTANITATANDGSGVSASCVVTVTFIDGIADIETSKVTVLAANGRITVSGKEKDDTVSVYDTGGRLLYHGESNVIDVPRKAMYIVTVSGKNYKVIVP